MTSTNNEHYDAIIVGAGQAGGPLAGELARSGRKTALVEREHVGGTCINEGCTPTKTMVASARAAYMARRASDYGVAVGSVGIDMQAVRERKRNIVDSFRGGSERRIKRTQGLDLIYGEATFTGPKSLQVCLTDGGTLNLSADLVFINTGARPAVPNIPGLTEVPFLNSTSIMELDEVPEHLLVIGGGYVGLEFAQMFRRFGSRVTLVVRGSRVLTREDPDIADGIADILREDGLELLLDTETVSVDGKAGDIRVAVSSGGQGSTISGSHLLVATGRTPNTGALHPEVAGIKMDSRGYIPVNERLETNVEGVYALGDVNGGPPFTHVSYDDYRIIRTNIVEGGNATTQGRLVPYTVYIDPQLGRVGLSETEAREKGLNIKVAKMPMSFVARALEVDEPRGIMKAVVDADSGQILGCAILGIEGGELMSMLEIAMLGKVPYTVLKDAIFAHPTLAESINNLFGHFKE